jgi:dihydroorotase
MGASTGNMLVDNPETLDKIFARAPLPVVTHCEDTPMIKLNEDAARAKYGEDVPFAEHPNIRSAEACYKSTTLAVGLARKHGTRLHVLHLTTAKELEFFTAGPVENKQITVEACVHHLYFEASRYADLGSYLKCNPAVKFESDRRALIQAVADGRIDIIATDHAPHTKEEKAGSYFKAPSGLPLVQHSLLALLELVSKGELTLETVVERACHAAAKRFGIVDRGFLREGGYADLVLVDPNAKTLVTPESIRYKCGWSTFTGHTFGARVDATWVNGQRVYQDGQLQAQALGQRLQFRALR